MYLNVKSCSCCIQEKEIVHFSKPEWTRNKLLIEKYTKYFCNECLLENDIDSYWENNS